MADKYNPIEEESLNMACEPLGGSTALAVDDEVDDIPSDLLGKAIEIALIEEQRGTLIPADKVIDRLYENLGWK